MFSPAALSSQSATRRRSRINRSVILGCGVLAISLLTACGSDSDGTSSGGGGSASADASHCVTRTFRRIYTNECNYDVYAILFEAGAQPFLIEEDDVRTRSSSGKRFGACRAPSLPVLNQNVTDYACR